MSMHPYKNINGNSEIHSYETGEDSITVQFNDGDTYVYNTGSAGADNIEHMKKLAVTGTGLHSFINNNVRNRYAYKIE
jgi:hypothetical protein